MRRATQHKHSAPSLPGGYTLSKQIGSGAFAVVYEGRDKTGRRVAVKVLDSDHPQAHQRFLREIKIMKSLPENEHIVRYYDDGVTEDKVPFIVMEYVVGFTLGKLLRSGRRLTESAACELMLQLSEAFQSLHKFGLTHGDIKPANIMLSKGKKRKKGKRKAAPLGSTDVVHLAQVERSGMQMKLLDFGLARDAQGLLKMFEEEDFIPGHDFEEDLDAGMLAGTPEYIAPEQVADARISDPKDARTDTPSDVFGLCVIFYELLSGKTPWPFRSSAKSEKEFKRQTKKYLDERASGTSPAVPVPNTSPALWSVLSRGLNHDPKKRQGDAKTLYADIERYVLYGAGVPGDLDNEETVMAYLPDLDATLEENQLDESTDPTKETSGSGRPKASDRERRNPELTGMLTADPSDSLIGRLKLLVEKLPLDKLNIDPKNLTASQKKGLWAGAAACIYMLLLAL